MIHVLPCCAALCPPVLYKSLYFLFAKQLRDSGLPADVLAGKLKKDI